MWLRGWMFVVILFVVASASVLMQYHTRSSAMVRALAAGVLAFCLVIYALVPPSLGEAVNAWTAYPMSSTSSPSTEIGPSIQLDPRGNGPVRVTIPARIGNSSDSSMAVLDRISVTFSSRKDTRVLDDGFTGQAIGVISRKFYDAVSGTPVDIQVSTDVFLYPPETQQTIQLSDTFQPIPGNLVCKATLPLETLDRFRGGEVVCRSAPGSGQMFRVYPRTLSATVALFPAKRTGLYSPMPSVSMNSGSAFGLWLPPSLTAGAPHPDYKEITVYIQDRPRRFHREFQYRNVILQDSMHLEEH
jgi:hypothetical protein